MTVAVAVIVSVLAPVLLAALTNRQRRQERLDNWARQDEIELRQKENSEKLDIIHHLVNSQLTAVMQAEADALLHELQATIRELAMMKQMMDLHELDGKMPDNDLLLAVVRTEAVITRLTENLAVLNAKINERHKNDGASLNLIMEAKEQRKADTDDPS